MERKKACEILRKLFKSRMNLMEKKNEDYTGDVGEDNFLDGFDSMSELCRILRVDVSDPAGVAVFLILLKLLRFSRLYWSGFKPNFDSIQDVLIDLSNYSDLLNLIEERRKESSKRKDKS